MAKYPCDSTFGKKGHLCGAYARKVRSLTAKKVTRRSYYGLKLNTKNLLKTCKGCEPGSEIIIGQAKYEDGSISHAVVLLRVTKKQVWWADTNWNWDNVTHYRTGTPAQFVKFYHYKPTKYSYLHIVYKTKKLKSPQAITVQEGSSLISGKPRLVWLAESGVDHYEISRAPASGGSFKKIAETKAVSFQDETAELGKKYRYRVTAFMKNTSRIRSSSIALRSRLDQPVPHIKFKEGSKKYEVMSWKPIEGAAGYKIYRRNKISPNKWKYIKTTTKTTYTDRHMIYDKKLNNTAFYQVQAVRPGNAAGSSIRSTVTCSNTANGSLNP